MSRVTHQSRLGRRLRAAYFVALSCLASMVLSGCAFRGDGSSAAAPTAPQSFAINGKVQGGQQPVSGATIQLWQVGTTGYGTGAAALGSSVTTDGGGSFSITGDYSCANAASGNNSLVYLTATGGNPGLSVNTNNSALFMMAGLGTCGSLTPSTFISINEVTTVASAYALAQFLSPSGSVGSFGSSTQGLTNAFAAISNLIDTGAGMARTRTPSGNGLVPQAELNTLADILAPCVNSSGPTSSSCSSLFSAVAPIGGVAPTTTLGAALSIALHPSYNVAGLLSQVAASAPFQPTVSSANDWTVALGFAAGGTGAGGLALDSTGNVWVTNYGNGGTTSSVSLLSPLGTPATNSPFAGNSVNGATAVAVDANNNAWIANRGNGSVVELSATSNGSGGSSIQAAGATVSGLNVPTALAVDQSNNVWVVNQGNGSLTELYASNYSGTPATYTGLSLVAPSSIGFDDADNAWIANSTGASVSKLNPNASPVAATAYTGGGLASPASLAIDGASSVWVTDSVSGLISKFSSAGTAVSSSAGYTGGGLSSSLADAIDGSSSLWVADKGNSALSALGSTGTPLSPGTGYLSAFVSSPSALAVDPSGNVWMANGTPVTSGSLAVTVTEFIGLAAPTVTPLAFAVQQAQLGQKPGTPATPPPVANAGGPYTSFAGNALSFSGAKSTAPAGQTITYAWSFGDGATGTGAAPTHAYAAGGSFTATLTVTATDGATATSTALVTVQAVVPTVTGFTPASGPVGTVVTVTGTNLTPPTGATTQVTLAQQGGGTLVAPISTLAATAVTFVVPAGAATGNINVAVGSQSFATSTPFTVTTSSSYTLGVAPATATLIQGQSTSFAVTISSTNNFPGLATLAVTGVPSGVTASFQPASVAVGQTALLTLTAPASQAVGTAQLSLTAAATIEGQAVSQTAGASLNVKALSTTFLGRTVVDDAVQEPIAGVTVKFLGVDDKGNVTGCSGSTVSDGGGNFLLTSLPAACIGPQLISYDGLTATAPAGKYAGVNLSYTLVSGQVTASPVLVHLPRIDNAETVQVQQNASTDQVFYFHTIPGVKATVYAGTTLTMPDGTTPNPFPLVAIAIPLDRLPDQIPTTGMLMPFIVAFQPANAFASQPVAVNFPNSLGIAPNTSVMFVTLDPTHGYMVPYGTGTVSSDGTEFVADPDPNHAGHAYGLVHFDWHGPATGVSPNGNNPGPDGSGPCGGGAPPGTGGPAGGNGGPAPAPCTAGDPVDIASGLVTYHSTDLKIGGKRGGLSVIRTYRTSTTNAGRFGRGSNDQFSMLLSLVPLLDSESLVTLIMPDGNQFDFNQQPDGSFANTQIPSLRGAVLTGNLTSGKFTLKWVDGTVYTFATFSALGQGQAFLSAITDLNGNTTTLNLNPSQPQQIVSITDPVGRSLLFTYDSSNRVTQITDPIGRKVKYTYDSSSGGLATVTDANGGVTKYTYDSSGNLATITDARGVVIEQNTYNESFDGRITQQVNADGGVTKFAYTLQNAKLATSPVLQTVVTDPLGNQTTYRFNMQGFLVSVTDASGQTRTLTRDPNHSNLVSDYTGNGRCPVCGDPAAGDIHYTFDALGNVLTRTDSLGNATKYTYDNRFNKLNSVTDPLGHSTAVQYDANGNATAVTDPNGNVTATRYDSFGEPVQTVDANGTKTLVAYDAYGNASSLTNGVGGTTNFTYDGVSRLTRLTDALGRTRINVYDPLDRITTATDPAGNKTVIAYDAVGNMTSLTDSKGNVVTLAYDGRSRLTTRTSALGKSQTYQYDTDSNLTQATDRRGQTTTFQHDSLNRLVKVTYPDSTLSNTFDQAGRLISVNDSLDGTFLFKYDAAGRFLQQSEPTGVVAYTRDAAGEVVQEQVVGQSAATYTYDPVGNLVSASMPNVSVTYAYDKHNLPSSITRSDGVVTSFQRDAVGEILSLTHARSGASLNAQMYKYDAVGNRSTVSNDLAQAPTTTSTTNSVDASNELVSATGVTYTYDANGNQITKTTSAGTTTYTWDSRNRLSSITAPNGDKTVLHYDFARGLLGYDQTVSGTTTRQKFLLDSLTNVVSIGAPDGSDIRVLTGREMDAHLASVDASGNLNFGLTDPLGSVYAVANASGSTIETLAYDAYGQTSGTVSSSYPFAYTGRIPVSNNVYYLRDRFYDASAGRFLSEDPVNTVGGDNLYQYAAGNPVNLTDPSGDSAVGIAIDTIVAGLAGGGIATLDKSNCTTDILTAVAVGVGGTLLAAGAVALLPEELTAGALLAATMGINAVVAAGGDIISQLIKGGPINTGEVIGSFVGGGLAGAFGSILGDPVEDAIGKIGGSLLRNANTFEFGFFGPIGGAIQNQITKAPEPCPCSK